MSKDIAAVLPEHICLQDLTYGLYIVATDIGNYADITIRALHVLNNVDFIICEEYKNGSRLLKKYGINKTLETLNEHNEKEQTEVLAQRLITQQAKAALISDAGTPLFADPGKILVEKCRYYNIPVTPVPGASSLMAALMMSGISQGAGQFFYYGFLPANQSERIKALSLLKKRPRLNYVFLETPYRLSQLIRDMLRILGPHREGMIAYKVTSPQETFFTGTLAELQIMTDSLPKGEFVFILYAARKKTQAIHKNQGKR